MKVAIVSDLHIGYERFADDALSQAREALESASTQADAIILPGDIFDKRYPKPEVIAQAINLFRELSKKEWKARVVSFEGKTKSYTNIPVIAISGTHERTAEGKDNPLNLLGLAGLLVDTSEATTTVEKDGERIAVYGLGGISEERVKDKLIELNPKPKQGAFNIFMFHQSTKELIPQSREEFISYSDLPKGFDLYVNGHIHSRVEASVHGKKLLIPGSTVLTQLKSGEQEKKGFILFDTKNDSYEFKYISSRRFVLRELYFDSAAPRDVLERCEKEIAEILSKARDKPVIRLSLDGTIKEGFNSMDLPVHLLERRYSDRAILEIDSKDLLNPLLEGEIADIRNEKIDNIPVRELGVGLLSSKLKELKFDSSINISELFNILSSEQNKEKAVEKALEYINGEE